MAGLLNDQPLSSKASTHITIIVPCFGLSREGENKLINTLGILLSTSHYHLKILLVKNGQLSQYFDSRFLELGSDKVAIVDNRKNNYYFNSLALGISSEICTSDYYMILNQDIELGLGFLIDNFLDNVTNYDTDRFYYAITMPICLLASDPSKVNCTGLHKRGPVYSCTNYMASYTSIDKISSWNIDYISGVCMIAHINAWKPIIANIGNWHAMYCEDIAISYAAKELKIDLLCDCTNPILHSYKPVYKDRRKTLLYIKGYFRLLIFKLKTNKFVNWCSALLRLELIRNV